MEAANPSWESMTDEELDDLHTTLLQKWESIPNSPKKDSNNKALLQRLIDLEEYCQYRGIEGYEFS